MVGSISEEDLSPKSKLKFLCSYGGRILPRPSDGQLKYVGGETRVVAVPRSVTFSELMEKLKGMFHADVVIKYQLVSEDLDALVSVKCDEDLKHMLEYDRLDPHSPSSSPRLRVFLFPSNPPTGHIPSCLPHEQRYVDAVNGIPVLQPSSTSASTGRSNFTLSSPFRTSPNSTLDATTAATLNNQLPSGRQSGLSKGMARVQSTPDISSLAESSESKSGQATPRFHQQQTVNAPQSVSPFTRLQKQHSGPYNTQPCHLSGPCKGGCGLHADPASFRYTNYNGYHAPRYQHLQPYYYVPYPSSGSRSGGGGGGYGHYGHPEEGSNRKSRPGCFHYGTPQFKRAWE